METAGYVFTSLATIELNPHVESVVQLITYVVHKTKINLPAIYHSSQVFSLDLHYSLFYIDCSPL